MQRETATEPGREVTSGRTRRAGLGQPCPPRLLGGVRDPGRHTGAQGALPLAPGRARWAAITTAAVFAAASQGQEPPTNASPRHCPWETTLRTKDKTEGRGQRFSKEGAAGIRCVPAHLRWGVGVRTTNPLPMPSAGVGLSGCRGSDGKKPLSPGSRLSLLRDLPREAVNYCYKLNVRVSPQTLMLNPPK